MTSIRKRAAYRIAFTYAAAFALTIVLLGTAVYFAADAEFRHQRDQMIAEELEDLAQEGLGAKLVHEITKREGWRTRDAFGYALFDPSGRQIAGKLATSRPPVGFTTIQARKAGGSAEAARAKAVNVRDGSRLVVALGAAGIAAVDNTILWLFGLGFLVVIVTGAVGALLLGRYLSRRLTAISSTTDAFVKGDLEHRVAISGQGDEFDTVGIGLNAMLDRIVALMENLKQISSDVAHDLRTPLLRLCSQLEQVGKVDGAAERALQQGDELMRLFSAILRISEVEGGSLEGTFAPVDLSTLVEEMGESFVPAVQDRERILEWSAAPGIGILGDRELLAQVMVNLIDNACVHTPPGTLISLDLQRDENGAVLSVSDDGPGVSVGEQSAILRRFYRAEASRTTPGNGLGLSLVAAVASAHRGTVTVTDCHPGLRVAIAFPAARLFVPDGTELT